MEFNWYRKELKDKYNILQKLKRTIIDKEELEKICDTMKVIEICLSKERVPGEIEILLEEDYLELTKTKFIWPHIKNIANINNDYIPSFSSDETILSKKDILDLLHEFFRNGTTKEIYELFCKKKKKNKKNIHFLDSPEVSFTGETIYLEYFKKTYIQVFKRYSFDDLNTFAHEFGHAIEFNMNFQNNLFRDLNVYVEIISIFFELICNEYFVKGECTRPAIITGYSTLDEHLENAKNLKNEFVLLNAISITKYENRLQLRSNIDTLVENLNQDDISNIMFLRPGRDYIYVFAFLVATNLFMIYKMDRDKAFYLVNKIINLNGELSCEEYFHELEKLELLDANKTQDYTNFIHNRSRKLK